MKGVMDMKMIQSFSVDHTAIVPGIFLSREDIVGDGKKTEQRTRYRCGGYAFARAHHRDLSQK